MTHTFSNISRKYKAILKELKDIIEPENNYIVYRCLLEQTNPPCVPYLGVFLQDCVYFGEMEDTIDGDKIDFDKRYRVGVQLKQIEKLQKPYNYRYVKCIDV